MKLGANDVAYPNKWNKLTRKLIKVSFKKGKERLDRKLPLAAAPNFVVLLALHLRWQ